MLPNIRQCIDVANRLDKRTIAGRVRYNATVFRGKKRYAGCSGRYCLPFTVNVEDYYFPFTVNCLLLLLIVAK